MESTLSHQPRPGQRPRILCVDDEPQVLEGLRDTLRRSFEVEVAPSGADGLAHLRSNRHGFAVVLSDMRMPGMSGAQFLREAKRVAPTTVRMLLTGYADTDSAVRAVNEGQIFRFLTKPCEREELVRACAAAVWQHRVLAAERVLLEQTLRGSVQALTDVLAVASPAAFGRGARVKRLVLGLAEQLGMNEPWEVEVAAMLAQVGAVTLPDGTAHKLYAGEPLSPAEQDMVERVPTVTERILANIPRLEGVQQILATYRRRFDSDGTHPVGARMLGIAFGYDELQAKRASPTGALERMRSQDGVYDPEMLEAFARVVGAEGHARRVRELSLADLRVGMTLVEDVRGRDRRLLISHGYPVTDGVLERLRNYPDGAVQEPIFVIDGGEGSS
jgi:response regulator RpfG family c-di-GMP phosphodiesterase